MRKRKEPTSCIGYRWGKQREYEVRGKVADEKKSGIPRESRCTMNKTKSYKPGVQSGFYSERQQSTSNNSISKKVNR